MIVVSLPHLGYSTSIFLRYNTVYCPIKKDLLMSTLEYSNGEITILWQPNICQHKGICVKMLPEVYKPKERPWIKIEKATTEQLKNQVAACPSGALSIKEVAPIAIVQEDDGKKGTFSMTKSEKEIGILDYVWAGEDMFIISHTEIYQKEPNTSYGTSLVYAAVSFARDTGKKILPLCPFAKFKFESNPSIHDVLYHQSI